MDIRFTFDGDEGAAEVYRDFTDLVPDDGLETSVVLSLFTDARAKEDDILPDNSGDRRGYALDSGLGSRLWLLERSKLTVETIRRAKRFAVEALEWMITEGVAKTVNVSVDRDELGNSMIISVEIGEPDGNLRTFKYAKNWASQATRSLNAAN